METTNFSSPENQHEDHLINESKLFGELQSKIKFYEDHFLSILSKYQETVNNFNIFRNFCLQNGNDTNKVSKFLTESISDNQLSRQEVKSLLDENAQLHTDFDRSCELLQQQQEMMSRLRKDNEDLKKAVQISQQFENHNEEIDKLQKENQDLQSLYEMMCQDSDELTSKNQALFDQVQKYKDTVENYKKEKENLEGKVLEMENEISRMNKILLSHQKDPLVNQINPSSDVIEDITNDSLNNSDLKQKVIELETRSEYLESELNRTSDNLEKSMKQQETLKTDHKKQWINLKNAKSVIEQYQKIELELQAKLKSAGIEIPQYIQPIYEEI